MRICFFWVLCCLSFCSIRVYSQADVQVRKAGKNESLSRSGQIIVRSEDVKERGVMATFAETVSAGLARILGDSKVPWLYRIVIESKGSMADAGVVGRTMVTRIDMLDGDKFELRLFVKLSDEFSRQQFSREILRLLLLERMLRKQQGSDQLAGKRLVVPAWILAGVDGLIEYQRLGRPSDLYASIVMSRQLLSVDEILKGNPEKLDSLSRATYEASAAALLGALFDQDRGAKSFGDLLARLTVFDGDVLLLLKQEFPGLRGGQHSVDKWWALQVASMGELQAMEYMGAKETEASLDLALQVVFPQEKSPSGAKSKLKGWWKKMIPSGKAKKAAFTTGQVHDFELFYKRKDFKEVLGQNQVALRALKHRCFPLYVPVVRQYEEVVARLLAGKRKHLAEDLQKIDQRRFKISQTMQRAVDYLNYYEATQLTEPGAAFEKYHQTRERLRREKAPVRSDRISKYLDEMERIYSGGGGR
ncbi:MAG: hypothetical protein L3J39_14255 [Verrucomicrobiales bacterium]|nr:hypothetical protein [Verrucomicrobiales bacterium]